MTSASAIIPAFRQCLPSRCLGNGHIPSQYNFVCGLLIYITPCSSGTRFSTAIISFYRFSHRPGPSSMSTQILPKSVYVKFSTDEGWNTWFTASVAELNVDSFDNISCSVSSDTM
jgi:hypothetical protein